MADLSGYIRLVTGRLRTSTKVWAGVVSFFLLLTGLALRIRILRSAAGWLNADEAVTGIMAMDILHGRFPIVLVGNAYTAPFESYLLAPFIAVFGAHVVPLKLISVFFWAIAAVVTVGAARQVMGRLAASLSGVLVWLAPGALLVLSTLAYTGYALGLAVVAGSLWSLFVTAGRSEPRPRQSALTGGLLGLAFYVHPMFLSVVVPGALVVSMRHFRRLRGWWVPAVGTAIAVNAPFLLWNAVNDFTSLNIVGYGGTYESRLAGFFTGLMPRALGFVDGPGRWILGKPVGLTLYGIVLLIVVAGALVLSRRGWKGGVAVATIALVWPFMALFSAHGYVLDGRYGIIPFVPIVLCIGAAVDGLTRILVIGPYTTALVDPDKLLAAETARFGRIIAVLAVVSWLALAGLYVDRAVGPAVADPNSSITVLAAHLEEEGVDRIGGSYWIIHRIVYITGGRIAGAVISPPWPVRSPRLQEIVESSPPNEVAYVFDSGAEMTDSLPLPTDSYERRMIESFVVYIPRSPDID